MSEVNFELIAGRRLKRLIAENYNSQQEFADDFGTDLRTVSRYVNVGIGKVSTLQELASFFDINIQDFFTCTQ